MSLERIEGQLLWENTDARELHEAGMAAQGRGDLAEAHSALTAAIRIVASEVEPSGDSVIQVARITRDQGFTYVREAIAERHSAYLEEARQTLLLATNLTEPLVAGKSDQLYFMPTESSLGEADEPVKKKLRGEIYAEHGSTLALLGRTATVRAVMLDIDSRGDGVVAREERKEKQKWYGRDFAHGYLKNGNNGYYLVSNAMNGARQEIINGQRMRAGKWVVRAAASLAWTTQYDRRNWLAARNTFLNRLPYLRSYDAAKASVLVKP